MPDQVSDFECAPCLDPTVEALSGRIPVRFCEFRSKQDAFLQVSEVHGRGRTAHRVAARPLWSVRTARARSLPWPVTCGAAGSSPMVNCADCAGRTGL